MFQRPLAMRCRMSCAATVSTTALATTSCSSAEVGGVERVRVVVIASLQQVGLRGHVADDRRGWGSGHHRRQPYRQLAVGGALGALVEHLLGHQPVLQSGLKVTSLYGLEGLVAY